LLAILIAVLPKRETEKLKKEELKERVAQLRTIFDAWAAESHPEWYTEAADPFPAGVAERLGS